MIIFFDTETTGLPGKKWFSASHYSHWPHLVEIAWIECKDDGTIITEFESIIKPDSFNIPKAASSIHGITTYIAQQNGRTAGVVLKQFCESLENCSFIVGHNVEFDINVITSEAFRLEICIPIRLHPIKCTMKSSVNMCKIKRCGGYKSPTLSELHTFLFGTPPHAVHRALADARTCMKCYFEMKQRGKF
jgi:DNA polymerase III epsilon subunit-like protein